MTMHPKKNDTNRPVQTELLKKEKKSERIPLYIHRIVIWTSSPKGV